MKEIKVKCPNCNGTGYIAHYDYNCQGICFRCNGKGYIMEKQYTKEELKKIESRISKKQQANEKELRGYKNTDTLYIIAEANTYDIKAQIKQDGAIWNQYFREWTFENDNLKDKYNLVAVKYENAEAINKNGIQKIKVDRTIKAETIENNNNDNILSVDDGLNAFFEELGI